MATPEIAAKASRETSFRTFQKMASPPGADNGKPRIKRILKRTEDATAFTADGDLSNNHERSQTKTAHAPVQAGTNEAAHPHVLESPGGNKHQKGRPPPQMAFKWKTAHSQQQQQHVKYSPPGLQAPQQGEHHISKYSANHHLSKMKHSFLEDQPTAASSQQSPSPPPQFPGLASPASTHSSCLPGPNGLRSLDRQPRLKVKKGYGDSPASPSSPTSKVGPSAPDSSQRFGKHSYQPKKRGNGMRAPAGNLSSTFPTGGGLQAAYKKHPGLAPATLPALQMVISSDVANSSSPSDFVAEADDCSGDEDSLINELPPSAVPPIDGEEPGSPSEAVCPDGATNIIKGAGGLKVNLSLGRSDDPSSPSHLQLKLNELECDDTKTATSPVMSRAEANGEDDMTDEGDDLELDAILSASKGSPDCFTKFYQALVQRHPNLCTKTFNLALSDCYGRFIINLPSKYLSNNIQLCFAIQEAYWWYDDYWFEMHPQKLLKLSMRNFGYIICEVCPLLKLYFKSLDYELFLHQWRQYCQTIPLRGAIIVNQDLRKVLMVQGWRGGRWMYPRGKVDEEEDDVSCAIREIREEVGVDVSKFINRNVFIEDWIDEQPLKLFIIPGVCESTAFGPRKRKEISRIKWIEIEELPGWKKWALRYNPHRALPKAKKGGSATRGTAEKLRFWNVHPFTAPLMSWLDLLWKGSKTRVGRTDDWTYPHGNMNEPGGEELCAFALPPSEFNEQIKGRLLKQQNQQIPDYSQPSQQQKSNMNANTDDAFTAKRSEDAASSNSGSIDTHQINDNNNNNNHNPAAQRLGHRLHLSSLTSCQPAAAQPDPAPPFVDVNRAFGLPPLMSAAAVRRLQSSQGGNQQRILPLTLPGPVIHSTGPIQPHLFQGSTRQVGLLDALRLGCDGPSVQLLHSNDREGGGIPVAGLTFEARRGQQNNNVMAYEHNVGDGNGEEVKVKTRSILQDLLNAGLKLGGEAAAASSEASSSYTSTQLPGVGSIDQNALSVGLTGKNNLAGVSTNNKTEEQCIAPGILQGSAGSAEEGNHIALQRRFHRSATAFEAGATPFMRHLHDAGRRSAPLEGHYHKVTQDGPEEVTSGAFKGSQLIKLLLGDHFPKSHSPNCENRTNSSKCQIDSDGGINANDARHGITSSVAAASESREHEDFGRSFSGREAVARETNPLSSIGGPVADIQSSSSSSVTAVSSSAAVRPTVISTVNLASIRVGSSHSQPKEVGGLQSERVGSAVMNPAHSSHHHSRHSTTTATGNIRKSKSNSRVQGSFSGAGSVSRAAACQRGSNEVCFPSNTQPGLLRQTIEEKESLFSAPSASDSPADAMSHGDAHGLATRSVNTSEKRRVTERGRWHADEGGMQPPSLRLSLMRGTYPAATHTLLKNRSSRRYDDVGHDELLDSSSSSDESRDLLSYRGSRVQTTSQPLSFRERDLLPTSPSRRKTHKIMPSGNMTSRGGRLDERTAAHARSIRHATESHKVNHITAGQGLGISGVDQVEGPRGDRRPTRLAPRTSYAGEAEVGLPEPFLSARHNATSAIYWPSSQALQQSCDRSRREKETNRLIRIRVADANTQQQAYNRHKAAGHSIDRYGSRLQEGGGGGDIYPSCCSGEYYCDQHCNYQHESRATTTQGSQGISQQHSHQSKGCQRGVRENTSLPAATPIPTTRPLPLSSSMEGQRMRIPLSNGRCRAHLGEEEEREASWRNGIGDLGVRPAQGKRSSVSAVGDQNRHQGKQSSLFIANDRGVDGSTITESHEPTSGYRSTRHLGKVKYTMRDDSQEVGDGSLELRNDFNAAESPRGGHHVEGASHCKGRGMSDGLEVKNKCEVRSSPRERGSRMHTPHGSAAIESDPDCESERSERRRRSCQGKGRTRVVHGQQPMHNSNSGVRVAVENMRESGRSSTRSSAVKIECVRDEKCCDDSGESAEGEGMRDVYRLAIISYHAVNQCREKIGQSKLALEEFLPILGINPSICECN